jgi:serine protease Do
MSLCKSITPALGVLLVLPSFAIEAPPDDAPPPADIARQAAPDPAAAPEQQAAASAYLGVVAEKIPDMLASHLNLDAGHGIVLRAVMNDSPAAAAGLRIHDVITHVAGQPVASSDELTASIRGRNPGETIKLDIVRSGKPQQCEVTLGKRPADLAAQPEMPLEQLNLDGIPEDFAKRVRNMIEGNLGERIFEFGEGIHDVAPEIDRAMQDVRKKMRDAMEAVPDMKIPGGIRINQAATIRLMDDEGSIELKSVDGGKEITARNPQGKITWTGPWDTEQDKAGAPEELRRRVERLGFEEQANGIHLRWNRGDKNPGGP